MTTASSSWLRLPVMDDSPHPYMILDSGAYSVWRSGAKVDFPRYHNYCKTVKDHVLSCVNLDVIPGKWGKRATSAQVEEAAEESYIRWLSLRKSGALMMNVYHQTDSIEWLERMLDDGAEYIGISPTDSFSAAVRQKWLADVHEWMLKRGVKLGTEVFTHGLGVFAPRILEGIPLWSADASTLLRYVAMKRIIVPKFNSQGKIRGWDAVYVGRRDTHSTTENVDWGYVYGYLHGLGYSDTQHFCWHRERVVVDEANDIISINLKLARQAMHESGVRCFVAGQHPLAIYQVAVVEKYPYILRSYAVIKETTGDTIKNLFNRTTIRPNRRPDKDHKVVPVGGLFA